MRGMILAAGRGERMGALTAQTPKPLLRVGNYYLIEYAIDSLIRAQVREIIINVSYQAEKIKAALGDGQRYGVKIFYSEEKERLETGGGILQALPLLGNAPFIVMSSDIITDYSFENLPQPLPGLAHLVMVNNPDFHPEGDFGLLNGKIDKNAKPTLTFASMGIYHPDLFSNCEPGHFRLTTVLNPAILNKQITGEHYEGRWYNIGTEKELNVANDELKKQPLFNSLAF